MLSRPTSVSYTHLDVYKRQNLGNLDAVDIPVRFLLNGKDLGAAARVSIPARKVLNFSVKAKFQNSGQASLGMSVDPQHTSADIDPDDNELSRTFQVLSFSNSFGGKWKNADGISVQILDKVKSLVDKEDFRLSMDGIVSVSYTHLDVYKRQT